MIIIFKVIVIFRIICLIFLSRQPKEDLAQGIDEDQKRPEALKV